MERFVAVPLPDGSYFQLRNLSWAAVEAIEIEHGVSWIYVIDAPQVNGRVLAAVLRAVAIENDLPQPEIGTAADLAAFSSSLVIVNADGQIVQDDAEVEEVPELEQLAWRAG